MQVFSAKQATNRRERRKLLFDIEKLHRLGKVYELDVEVKVETVVTDVTHVGVEGYFSGDSSQPTTELPNKAPDSQNPS